MSPPFKSTFSQDKRLVELFCFCILSIVFIWIILPFGPGMSNDSLLYLECGDHLFSGKGFTVIGHIGNLTFASDRFPFFPIALKTFSYIGITPLIFQILSFCIFSFLLMRVLISFSPAGNRLLFSILAFLTLLFPFVLVFYNLWTEGVFLILLLITILIYNTEKNILVLLILLALLSLTRMVGLTVGISIAIAWMLQKKYAQSVSAIFFSVLPVAVWAMVGFWLGNENSRQLSIHWISFIQIQQFFATLGSLLINGTSWQTLPGILLFVTPALLSAKFFFKHKITDQKIFFLIILFYIYPLFLFLSLSLLDHSTPMDERILAPQFLLLLLIVSHFLLKNQSFSNKITAPLLLLTFLSLAIRAKDYRTLHENGYGYNSKETKEFKFQSVIKSLPQNTPWYTNQVHGVYHQTGKIAFELPLKFEIHNNRPNPGYESEWQNMLPEIINSSGTIVWIRSGALDKSFISYEELKTMDGLSVIYDDWLCLVMSAKQRINH